MCEQHLPEGVIERLPSDCKDAQAAKPHQADSQVQQRQHLAEPARAPTHTFSGCHATSTVPSTTDVSKPNEARTLDQFTNTVHAWTPRLGLTCLQLATWTGALSGGTCCWRTRLRGGRPGTCWWWRGVRSRSPAMRAAAAAPAAAGSPAAPSLCTPPPASLHTETSGPALSHRYHVHPTCTASYHLRRDYKSRLARRT